MSLHQSHLPKLDGYGVIDYDLQAKFVRLRDSAPPVLSYVDRRPVYGLTWGEFYVVTALCGLTLVEAAELDVPIIGTFKSATGGDHRVSTHTHIRRLPEWRCAYQ